MPSMKSLLLASEGAQLKEHCHSTPHRPLLKLTLPKLGEQSLVCLSVGITGIILSRLFLPDYTMDDVGRDEWDG